MSSILYVLNKSSPISNYVDTFHQYGLVNEINLPTHVLPSTGIATSSIDHLWLNFNSSRRSYVVSPALFDHCAIYVIFRSNLDSPPKSISFRDLSEANAELFASNFENAFI